MEEIEFKQKSYITQFVIQRKQKDTGYPSLYASESKITSTTQQMQFIACTALWNNENTRKKQ